MRLHILAAAVLSTTLALGTTNAWSGPSPAAPAEPAKYVSGGVGEESDARMQALTKDYNLRLLFAAKDGHYLADVDVVITDVRGTKVLDAVSEGPWLLATLAPGKYEISAKYAGTSVKQATTIPVTGRREVVFRWVESE